MDRYSLYDKQGSFISRKFPLSGHQEKSPLYQEIILYIKKTFFISRKSEAKPPKMIGFGETRLNFLGATLLIIKNSFIRLIKLDKGLIDDLLSLKSTTSLNVAWRDLSSNSEQLDRLVAKDMFKPFLIR